MLVMGKMRQGLTFAAVLTLALLATAARADTLRDHLSVFFEFNALDSVISLEQKSPTTLQVTVADGATGGTRSLSEEVGAKPMQKFLNEANDLGLKVLPFLSVAEVKAEKSSMPAAPATSSVSEKTKSKRSISSERKNRMWYIAYQSALSTYVYGISIPIALDASSAKVQIATPMIIAPFAFGTHFWFAKNRPFEDSHRKGTFYLSSAALYASYALPFSLMNLDDNPFRVASFLSLAAYPAGIYGGYLLGDKYVDLPGRIDTEEKFAIGFGTMGFFSPFLYFEKLAGHEKPILRLALGQSVVMATLGHFLADHYRTGQNIPDGVNTGIMDHTFLGAGLGLEVAALADADIGAVRPWIGAALLGGTFGFMEGLFYYRNSYDSQERGLYNTLGGMGGTLLGGGLAFLFYDDHASAYAHKTTITSLLVAGTLVGYIGTNFLTMGMEDRGASNGPPSWTDHLAFNPIPVPEAQFRDRELYLRYHIPGFSYRF